MAFDAYRSYRTASFVDELLAIAKGIVAGGLILGAIAFALKLNYLSRGFILSFVVINFAIIGTERFAVRSLSWAVRRHGYNFRNVLIVGTNDTARDIAQKISQYHNWGLRLAGFIAEDVHDAGSSLDGIAVVARLQELETFIRHEAIDEVIFCVPFRKLPDLEDTFLMLEEHGINARIAAQMFPHLIARMGFEELETVPLLTFSTVPENTIALAIKRFSDIVLAVVLMICSFPIVVAAALAVKATSSGPVLFKQKRSGLHGRTFTLYKFRSMYRDAESLRSDLERLNEMEGPVFKIKADPRITPLGRFLRRTSIDELPQLWNVLKGDMSIVGPRPPVPEEVEKYERWQRRRLSMRPGITCIWQISGRNKISDFDQWVKLDLQYIDTWSLALDLKIFLKTIPVVLFQRGAV
jgi:exopolysaccharide biosynthesis polyprenyl glycosylphosphotransferase